MATLFYGSPEDYPDTIFHNPNEKQQYIGLPNYWVNTAGLNLVIQDRIYAYKGLGPGISFMLTYNATPSSIGFFGRSWSFNYDSNVRQTNETIILTKGSGQQIFFRLPIVTSGNPPEFPIEAIPPDGIFDRLLNYGTFLIYLPKHMKLLYRYEKVAHSLEYRLTSVADFDGNTVFLQYDSRGLLTKIIDAAGRETLFSVNAEGKCSSLHLPDGRIAHFSYDNAMNLIQVLDLQKIPTLYEYNSDHYVIRITVGKDQKTTSVAYQKIGGAFCVASITDAAGNTSRFEMASVAPQITKVVDPDGNTKTFSSSDGMTHQVTDQLGNSIIYEYTNRLRTSAQNKNHNLSRVEYDGRGNVVNSIDPVGNSTRYEYDLNDNIISEKLPNGLVVVNEYDEKQHLRAVRDTNGYETFYEYDQKGQLTAIISPSQYRSTITYDRYGNVSTITDPLNNTTISGYDSYGFRQISVTDPRGNITRFEYDNNDRMVKRVNPDGTVRIYTHGCCAGLSTTDELGHTSTYTRNPILRITALSDEDGERIRYEYDRNNRRTAVVDPFGRRTIYTYDSAGRRIRITHPSGEKIVLKYDPEGNIEAIIDENGNMTSFSYDQNNLLKEIRDSSQVFVHYVRNEMGMIVNKINSRKQIINHSYDTAMRLTGMICDGTSLAAYRYDKTGNLTEISSPRGITSYGYNAGSQITAIHYPDGTSLVFAYDKAGNVASVTYPGGLTIVYSYDMNNRIAGIRWQSHSITFEYDRAGHLVREGRSNGLNSEYTYDNRSRLSGITHKDDRDLFAGLLYTWDAADTIVRESAEGLHISPDIKPSESRVNDTIVYNQLNQIISCNNDRYAYDADGNLISIAGSRTLQATYDAENRLIHFSLNGKICTFGYNGLGEMTESTVDGLVRHYHHGLGGQLMFETDEKNTIINYYIYSGGRLAAIVKPAGETYFYHFDKNGNTLLLSNEKGECSVSYGYDLSENSKQGGNESIENPFTFVGALGVMQVLGGLYFMRHRFYDARTRRFLQRDPLGTGGGLNLYAYAKNNPVTFIDPTGESAAFALFLLFLATVAVTTGAAAYRFGNKNPLTRTLAASVKGNAELNKQAHGPNPPAEFFNDPDHGAVQIPLTAADKVIAWHPYIGIPYRTIKYGYYVAEDRPGRAIVEYFGITPIISDVFRPGKNIYDIGMGIYDMSTCDTPYTTPTTK